jgi:SAM-dependent methyltransferase
MYTLESTSILWLNQKEQASQAPPPVTDLVGYESLLQLVRREKLDRLQGDFLEIGCFLGGGTAKLAALAEGAGKQVWVIDVFDPGFDQTRNTAGERMADLYSRFLDCRSQADVFRHVTKPWAKCIRLIQQDSMKARLPEGTRLAFAFVDGNHDPAWIRNDFQIVWKHLAAGGWAGFHDYAGDLPQVTDTLNSLLTEYSAEIDRVERIKDKWVLLVRKSVQRTEWKKL